ncbi:hypothetical protein M1555_00815 [Patescibacteria group bacterium]|nr:hypothetical protein [Patescibacteria group bacterium]
MAEGDRDYLGDQIGWAVRQMLPPTPELRKIDRAIMTILPRPIARLIALFRFEHGLLPTSDDPTRMIDRLSNALGANYADTYGSRHRFNTVVMPGIADPMRAHTPDFHEGEKEMAIRWEKQVSWAQTIIERVAAGEILISVDDRVEASTILITQSKIEDVIEKSKPEFVKRGLPFPDRLLERDVVLVGDNQ